MDFLFLIAIAVAAYFTGSYSEKRHLSSIRERERQAPHIPVLSTEDLIPHSGVQRTCMVAGSTVVGIDYFRNILGGLINFFGGRVSMFESALDRARREALLRLRDEAKGADFIGCVRYETCILTENQPKSLPKVSVIAYGTAFYMGSN